MMNISLLKKIDKVKYIKVSNDNILFILDNSILLNEVSYKFNRKFFAYFNDDNLFLEMNRHLYYFDFQDKEFKEYFSYEADRFTIVDRNKFILCSEDENCVETCTYFHSEESYSKNSNEVGYLSFPIGNKLYYTEKFYEQSKFVCRLYEDSSYQWTYEMPKGLFLKSHLIHIHNLMIIPTNANSLIAVDLDTGAEKWQIEDCFSHYSIWERAGLLVGFGFNSYHIIDPKSGTKTILKDLKDDNDLYQLSLLPHKNNIYGDRLYFSTSSSGENTQWGIYDLKEKKFIHLEKIPLESRRQSIGTPLMVDQKVYVRTSDDIVYIYEILSDEIN